MAYESAAPDGGALLGFGTGSKPGHDPASIELGSAGTSTAYSLSTSSGTNSSARSWVAARTTNAATPSAWARSHAWVVTHQRSPGVSPGKRYSGIGVLRSLPTLC